MLYSERELSIKINNKQKVDKCITIIICSLIIPLLIYNVTLIIQIFLKPYNTPSFLGIKTYVIISGSMEPNLNIGDIVITKNVLKDNLKEGDIISFRKGQAVITHRIIEVIYTNEGIEYKTKGDNNNTEDTELVKEQELEGRVITRVPFIGNIYLLLKNRFVIIFIIVLFYIYIYRQFKLKKRKDCRALKRIKYENKKLKGVLQ